MNLSQPLRVSRMLVGMLLAAPSAHAIGLHWSGNGTTQGGGGNWDTTSSRWGIAPAGPYQFNWNNANNGTAVFGGAAGTVTLATGINVSGIQLDAPGQVLAGNIITFGMPGGIVANQAATVSSILAGGSILTKSGAGTLTLNSSAANTFNGGINLNGGTLLADFANLTTPTNLIPAANAVGFGGGALSLKGKSTGATGQTLNNITVNAGGGQILGNKNGGSSLTIALGSITATATGSSLLVGNATTSTGNAPVITTTTNRNANRNATTGIHGGRMVFFTGAANTGYDWASTTTGSSPYTLSGYNSYTPLPDSGGSATVNYIASASTTLISGFSVNTLKFAPGSTTSQTIDLGGGTTVTSLNSVNGGNPPLASSCFGRPTTVANGTIDIGGTAQGGVTLKYTGPGETTDRILNFIFNGNGATKTIDASGTGILKFTSTFI